MSERAESPWTRCLGSTPTDRRNLNRLVLSCLVWAVLTVGGSQLIKRELLPDGVIPWIVVAVLTFAGLFVIMAYGRFLREADELQRLIHMEALAIGFGGAWVAVSTYRLLERIDAVPTADIADATMALSIFYSIGIVRSTWRYR